MEEPFWRMESSTHNCIHAVHGSRNYRSTLCMFRRNFCIDRQSKAPSFLDNQVCHDLCVRRSNFYTFKTASVGRHCRPHCEHCPSLQTSIVYRCLGPRQR